jgi:glycosyltransferase involved in cell wall biosynthesis
MIESLACGTPVLAWNCGSVPEIIDQGITGFILDSEEQALAAIERATELDRSRIRNVFDRRFAARAMAEAYVQVYEQVKRHAPMVQKEYVRLVR